eukprot:gnl/TRDRNA2_/TRDRNA2_159281_c0_seq1.p1 gnl/TRDRNA2_/TRDRNA2_159281_c0~~gnl/TRDRNA2_/TRDRNA2_159281_c0_seq1.p1  ORF type:complete len:431 (-),score=114.93 gnl/TRDRNA2_/TRDRNA2_159281_c0_seq1:128-1378(-)
MPSNNRSKSGSAERKKSGTDSETEDRLRFKKSAYDDSELSKVAKKYGLKHPKYWCVTVPDCEDLAEMIPPGTSSPDYPKSPWSMGCVVKHIVKPKTLKFDKTGKTGYAQMLHPKGLKVTIFVSHAWRESFKEFVVSLRKYSNENLKSDKDDSRGFWICALGLPQNNEEILQELLAEKIPMYEIPFASAMYHAKIVLCVRNSAVDLHSRPWCLFEMRAAVSFRESKQAKGRADIKIRACGPKKFTEAKSAKDLMKDALDKVKRKADESNVDKANRHAYRRIKAELTAPGALEKVEEAINQLALNTREDKPDKSDAQDEDEFSEDDDNDAIVLAAGLSGLSKEKWDKKKTKDKVKKAFKKYDVNDDGSISKKELTDVLKKLHPGFTKAMAESLFDNADSNKDGKIDIDEFTEYIFNAL